MAASRKTICVLLVNTQLNVMCMLLLRKSRCRLGSLINKGNDEENRWFYKKTKQTQSFRGSKLKLEPILYTGITYKSREEKTGLIQRASFELMHPHTSVFLMLTVEICLSFFHVGLKYPKESEFVRRLRELENSTDVRSIPLIPSTPEEMEDMLKLCSYVRFKIPRQVHTSSFHNFELPGPSALRRGVSFISVNRPITQ